MGGSAGAWAAEAGECRIWAEAELLGAEVGAGTWGGDAGEQDLALFQRF